MLVGLSNLIEKEMTDNTVFSLIYGDNYRLFTLSTENVSYALTKQEEKRIIGLTNQLLVHLAMVIYSEDDQAIDNNCTDIVNGFLIPVYIVCQKNHVPINAGLLIKDDVKSEKSVLRSLKDKHHHSGNIDFKVIMKAFDDITYWMNRIRLDGVVINKYSESDRAIFYDKVKEIANTYK